MSLVRDLFEVIPSNLAEHSEFCSRAYWVWEDAVALPALESAGYGRATFHMGERDSFGPLTRKVRAYKGGVAYEFIYG